MFASQLKWNPLAINKINLPKVYLDRFMSQVVVRESGCWEWIGSLRPDGYGQMTIPCLSPYPVRTHRLAYQLAFGEPEKQHIHHVCENKCCANPAHLKAVTPKEHITITPSSISYEAKNKTHCPQGHPYDEANTYIPKGGKAKGKRICRACSSAAKKNWAIRTGRQTGLGHSNRRRPPRRTHCKYGHELTPDNIYILNKQTGARACKICAKRRAAEFNAAHRQQRKVTVTV